MRSRAISPPLIPVSSLFSTRSQPAALCAVVVALTILWPAAVPGQMVEERDRDEPPSTQAGDVPRETSPDLAKLEQLIVDQTNELRKQQQRENVAPHAKLNETAQYFADYMARTNKYGHMADGKRPSERADDHGYEYCLIAENIAYQYRSSGFTAEELAERFVSGWEQSPEHRKNMLDPDVTEIGVAVARGQDSPTYFAVQMFGRPQSKTISFQVRNESNTEVEYTISREESDRSFPLPPGLARTHERCRPAKLKFGKPNKTLAVENDARYVVRQTANGDLDVTQQQ